MKQFLFLILFLVGWVFLYFLVHNDYDEHKNLSKKGFKKLLIGMGIIFVAIVILIGLME
ncbi:hypothetical protein WMZ97_01605 [Lentibacillus sp. N15]|uniref:hypothetical protein n=1 Tax=Lentibacillus songyuanensis TaxID=3136161 RepID=UPI0031BBAED5